MSSSSDFSRDRAKEFHQWFENRQAANRDSLINILSSSTSSLSSSELIKDYETRDCQLKGRKVRLKRKKRDKELIDCTFRRSQMRSKKNDKVCDFCILPKNIVCLTAIITCLVVMFILMNYYTRLERFNQVLRILDHQQQILTNDFADLRRQLELQSKQISSLTNQVKHLHENDLISEGQLQFKLLLPLNDSNQFDNQMQAIVQKLSIKVETIVNQLNNRINIMDKRLQLMEDKFNSSNNSYNSNNYNRFPDESIALLSKRLIDTQVNQVEIKSKLNFTLNLVEKLAKTIGDKKVYNNNRNIKSTSKAINHHTFNDSFTSKSNNNIVTGHLS